MCELKVTWRQALKYFFRRQKLLWQMLVHMFPTVYNTTPSNRNSFLWKGDSNHVHLGHHETWNSPRLESQCVKIQNTGHTSLRRRDRTSVECPGGACSTPSVWLRWCGWFCPPKTTTRDRQTEILLYLWAWKTACNEVWKAVYVP